ncbi:MFS transporter [Limosilactobacillus sp. STM2_1]|uniref:MFS transporter n=1 Tax=Limosilactobacillus rudii TaxID=2759755 RepID=A0A7W3UJG8_9LACO|nr:MFS transporter [Limosilactobacillus rudii]MBB1078700.1 MFS transporter [Limosilactobacillus rudii]MBB1096732.1 MFS transporter [Limosilactobacillus rudii]MCD7135596.1 MFS transporter [Limosilactobacillus rudii]
MSKFRLQSIIFVLTAFLLGCNEFMVVGVISDIAKSYQTSLSTVGFLVTSFAIIYAICTPLITTFTGKFDRFKVLMVLMAIFLIGNTLTAFAPNLFWLFVSRILTAAVAGAIISLILVFVSIIAPIEKRAMLVASTFAGFSIATIIGVPVGTAISNTFSWRDSFALISVLTIIICGFLLWLVPRNSRQANASLSNQLKLLKDQRIILGIVVMIMLMAAEYTFYTYIRPIITTVLGFSTTELTWLLGLVGITFIIGNTCAGVVANRFGITKLTLISGAVFICLLVMNLMFHISWLGIILLCLICFILGMPGSILQVMFLNVADRDYPEAMNLASSLNPICTNIGVSVGSLTASISVNYVQISQIGYVGAIYALIAVFGSYYLIKNAHK